MLSCHEITTEIDFAHLRKRWEELFSQCAFPAPFCSWDWAWHWWQMGKEDPLDYRLLILTVSDSRGTLVGIAPFYYPSRPRSPWRLIPLRQLGTQIRCRMEDMTDEPILLLREGHEQDALRAILFHLAHSHGASWDLAHLDSMRRRDGKGIAALCRQRYWNGVRYQTHLRYTEGQIVSLPASWGTYLHSLSRSMRDNLPYYPRLLARHGHEWTVQTARTPSEVAAATSVLIDLHHRRSQSKRGTRHQDHLPGKIYEQFLKNTMTALAAQGRARIVLLDVAGTPIAAQAVLEHDPMVTFYYSGFDPAWHSYSPITILNAHVIADAIARGLRFVDYLPEAAPWKTRWGVSSPYVLEALTWIPLRPRAILRMLLRPHALLRALFGCGLARAWQRRFGEGCECGFCALPLSRSEESSADLMEHTKVCCIV